MSTSNFGKKDVLPTTKNIDATYSVAQSNICGIIVERCELDTNYIIVHAQNDPIGLLTIL